MAEKVSGTPGNKTNNGSMCSMLTLARSFFMALKVWKKLCHS